ncbi:MAG: ABC transporter permease [Candidatus Wallbacteria bacterium]|nr:ABC transporter permease [Candidatus Wallbacteria bacterium]
MLLKTLVRRELFERRSQLLTSFFAILLGITAVVSIRNVSFYSEKAVALELDALGANILVLPKSASVQDYYSADMQNDTFPEEYVTRLTTSDLQGLDNLSPKLSTRVEVGGNIVTVTGILPKSEFQAKAAWQGAGIFMRPQGCGTVITTSGQSEASKKALARKRTIDTFDEHEALVGADVASRLRVVQSGNLTLFGETFTVSTLLPQTGTVDDARVFIHLHTLQRLLNKGTVLNAIEIVGCCNEISKGLVQKINGLLPEAKVMTINQVVDTQIRTNRLMAQLSTIFIGIIVLLGGASIANYMYANVFERRREIGTLMAMGATSSLVMRLFLLKAFFLGIAGGAGGYLLGTLLAVIIGPEIAEIPVLPMPILAVWSIGLSVLITMCASYFPARRAAGLDPCTALQEV